MKTRSKKSARGKVLVRPMQEADLFSADNVMRLAFGTFLGLPEPKSFMGDADFIRPRWKANPHACFAAKANGEVVGSGIATHWGSVGFLGPLTVRPDFWDKGVGSCLMEPIMACFKRWRTKHAGLFTFAHSPKHIGLYQKFGFSPRFLTAVMSKTVERAPASSRFTQFSDAKENERKDLLIACRKVTDAIYDGLDLGHEIQTVADQRLGETILIWNGDKLTGFAICHHGAGTEAGSGACYVKFGTVRSGHVGKKDFNRLLKACEAMASQRKLSRLVAGVNTARHEAYRQMLAYGFRSDILGVVMAKPNEPGYNRPDVYLIDDWR